MGGTATYNRIAFDPGQKIVPAKWFFQVRWTTPPAADWRGEDQHGAMLRYTFLEYFGIKDVRALAGQTVTFRFWARVDRGQIDLIPLLWHSYDPTTPVKGKGYELFEASGKPGVVAVASGKPNPHAICRVDTIWRKYEKRITLPSTVGKTINPGHYTGAGFDMTERFTGAVEIANIEVLGDKP